MKILFVHQNFPGQFKHLAPALVLKGHDVRALHMQQSLPTELQGVDLLRYEVSRQSTDGIHPWVVEIESKAIRSEAVAICAEDLKSQGYLPDVIVGHPGWGEMLFLKDVWPSARIGLYAEFYYHPTGMDVDFDPEFPFVDTFPSGRLAFKNLTSDYMFSRADAALAPTEWQRSIHPPEIREKIDVIHDGIDTKIVAPNPSVAVTINNSIELTRASEVITFVNRNLEPYRGYHIFMRALPRILEQRPNARVLIIGGDGVSYGRSPTSGTWKERFINEVLTNVSPDIRSRVSFLGKVPYDHYLAIVQLSTVHIYLTYPFVLSWSLLEAMSAGCAIVASRTSPVLEAVRDGETGVLVDFFDVDGLADAVISLLADPDRRRNLGLAARAFAQMSYDLEAVCLPKQIAWVEALDHSQTLP